MITPSGLRSMMPRRQLSVALPWSVCVTVIASPACCAQCEAYLMSSIVPLCSMYSTTSSMVGETFVLTSGLE